MPKYCLFILSKKYIFILFISLIFSKAASAQEKITGSWNVVNIKKIFNKNWSAYTEFQLRSLSFYDRFYYYEWKGGITYSFLSQYSITAGGGVYNTFNEGEHFENYSRQKEVRLWQQFIMDQKLSILEIEHRYRTEQRFKNDYENRFRYRLNVSVPFNKKEITMKTWYGSVYNELFFSDDKPHFSRNRFQIGMGYRFNEVLGLQTGWIRQVDFNKDWTRRKNYIMMLLSLKI